MTDERLRGLIALLDNRQMPDHATPKVTLGELRSLRAAIDATPKPALDAECWFCKGTFPMAALIAGYDTFDEQRLACLACNERMQGNWRPDAARLSQPTQEPGAER